MSDLDELMRLHDAATPGTWKVTTWYGGYHTIRPKKEPEKSLGQIERKHDAAYICAACNAVPELVARIRELEDAAEFEARVSAKMAEPWISSGGKPKCKHKGCIVPLLRQKLKLRDVERICAWCVIKDARLAVEREMIAEGKGPVE